jgi:signal transduction histidine kinase
MKKTGEWMWVSDVGKITEWDEQGKPLRVIGLFYDLTKEKENQQQLIQLNATKDKFFSIIAHDLKNPFGSILGFSNLIDEECRNAVYDNVRQYNSYILQSAQSGFELLKNLLDWSRIQNGKIQFHPENIDLLEVINDLTVLLMASLNEKKQEIKLIVSSGFMIYADRLMIGTILRNLISNAIKFTPEGGRITVSAVRSDGNVEIRVSDTGVGISPEKAAKLFKIEESFSTLGTNKEQGTGLGLILCRDFVNQHHGTISFESEDNKGSTFVVLLPEKSF